jgi:Type IV secretory pathway, VirB11 components, and related ATPases involved in archaeal flagella biosynthesis
MFSPALRNLYVPLKNLIDTPELIEISVVKGGEIGLELDKIGYQWLERPDLDLNYWRIFCELLANQNNIQFDFYHHPVMSCALPGDHRFEVKLGPQVESGIDVSIRIARHMTLDLEAYGVGGALKQEITQRLAYGSACFISGGTSTGKTTFLKALTAYIPVHLRILTLEDAREIVLPQHRNKVHHILPRHGDINIASIYKREIDHLLRSRPDYIILGETSSDNALSILRAINTGHPGFLATVHANSPALALHGAFPQNLQMAGTPNIHAGELLEETLDMVFQLARIEGKRVVSEIYFPKEKRREVLYEACDKQHI